MLQVLTEDSTDWYNTRLKPLLVVAVTLWLVSTFVLRSSSHNVVTPLHNGSQPMWVSHSRDAGLQMTLRQPIPPYLLQLHSVAGALLLVGCIVQKQLVVLMATNPRAYAFLHRLNGCLCLLCMICMFVGGYMMGPYSSWAGFELFSLFFALPWLVWSVLIFMSARAASYRWHRLFGNQCLKGCIAVPWARLCGALVQSYFPQLGEAYGYYAGIGAVTLAIALWEAHDIYLFVLQPCAMSTEMQRRKDKSDAHRGKPAERSGSCARVRAGMRLAVKAVAVAVLFVLVIVSNPPPFSFDRPKQLVLPQYAPVSAELTQPALPVGSGSVPAHLIGGRFLRVGPNAAVPDALPYHWFDGDGMIFDVGFTNATSVSLRNRYVRTPRLLERLATRKAINFLGELHYPWRAARALVRLVNSAFRGTALAATTANTALLWQQRRLFALNEGALPFELDAVTLEPRGLFNLSGRLRSSMTAHPKYCAASRELIFFGYIPPSASLHYYIWGENDVFSARVDFSGGTGSRWNARMPHDFAATRRFTVWLDLPSVRADPLQLMGLANGGDDMPPRIVWHGRRTPGNLSWAPIRSASVFHVANAWDDERHIVVIACRADRELFYFDPLALEQTTYLHEWVVDLVAGTVTEQSLLDQNNERVPIEFPQVNPSRAMQESRYVWGMALGASGKLETAIGIVKYDRSGRSARYFLFQPSQSGQEPLFVPDSGADEDAGSLMTFVFDSETHESSLCIVDAASMQVRAWVALRSRVPMGFHTLFLSRDDLLLHHTTPASSPLP